MNKLAYLEAILFMTTEPLSIEDLQKNLKGRKDEIEKLLTILRQRYQSEESGVMLSESGGYRLIVKPEYVQKVSHLTPHSDMSRGLLRVLSIIAYHEPVPQSEIVKTVGNRTYEYVKELESRGLVKSEKKSRTKLLSTTQHFEEYFGARKEEIRKIAEEAKKEEKESRKDTKEAENKAKEQQPETIPQEDEEQEEDEDSSSVQS